MEVPCGSCLGCRLDRSRHWAMRMVHETMMHDDNVFITLTYDDDHLPTDESLDKVHFQKFMKRLRKCFPDRRIRYYHCGEYGDKYNRPHYHACLFDLDFPDKQLLKQEDGYLLFSSKMLEEIWGNGYVGLGDVTFQSAAYCARYVTKKVTGEKAHEHYSHVTRYGEMVTREPEYSTMSKGRKCAKHRGSQVRHFECEECTHPIGAVWWNKYKDDMYPWDHVPVPGTGVVRGMPRFYDKLLEETDEEMAQEIARSREVFREKHKEEYTPNRLFQKYKVKKAQLALTNKRGLEDEI